MDRTQFAIALIIGTQEGQRTTNRKRIQGDDGYDTLGPDLKVASTALPDVSCLVFPSSQGPPTI
jgi:hypothetical protein